MTRQALRTEMSSLPTSPPPSPGVKALPTTQRGQHVLMDMLTYARPAFGQGEADFIERFLAPLEPHEDHYGNLWLQIGETPNILWSSHTDTVHHNDGRQTVAIADGIVSLARKPGKKGRKALDSSCLGADCTAGVWIMREMILAGVEGLYVFHRDEEAGGRGSRWIADNTPHLLEGITFAIAFDRKGYGDIITHQGGRTASDAFAKSLAAILGGAFQPDDTGLFTDTASYSGLIPECSNVSVGYFKNHGPAETLDAGFLMKLRDTVVKADFSTLVAAREPGEDDYPDYGSFFKQAGGWADDFDFMPANDRRSTAATYVDFVAFIREHPHVVADFLESMGAGLTELEEHAACFH